MAGTLSVTPTHPGALVPHAYSLAILGVAPSPGISRRPLFLGGEETDCQIRLLATKVIPPTARVSQRKARWQSWMESCMPEYVAEREARALQWTKPIPRQASTPHHHAKTAPSRFRVDHPNTTLGGKRGRDTPPIHAHSQKRPCRSFLAAEGTLTHLGRGGGSTQPLYLTWLGSAKRPHPLEWTNLQPEPSRRRTHGRAEPASYRC